MFVSTTVLPVRIYTTYMPDTRRDQKKVLDSLELSCPLGAGNQT